MKHPFQAILALVLLATAASASQATPYQSLNYLYEISGSRTLAGHHNREPNYEPTRWTDRIYAVTGQHPALWSGDFLFQGYNIDSRGAMIKEAKRQWEAGAIINIMWHACNPAKWQPCDWDSDGVLSQMSDWEWHQLLTDGTPINQRWKEMMDEIALYLQDLEDSGVEVLFRPLHEMNQGIFWWGGRPGPDGTRALYQLTHDYLTHEWGLSNLIWVWNMQDFYTLEDDLPRYNPGDEYWDVATLDIYEGFETWKYEAMVDIAGDKPIAIGESHELPSPERLAAEPRWTFFMGWAELPFEHQSNADIQRTYFSDRVTYRAAMPGWDANWDNWPDHSAPNIAYDRAVTASASESGHPPSHINDADGNTRWSSGFSDDQWITIDLGEVYAINRVRLDWEAAYGRAYDIQVSDDGQSWRTVYQTTTGVGGEDNITHLNAWGRYVRMLGRERGTQWGYSLYEFEIYGEPAGDAMPQAGSTYVLVSDHSGKALDVAGGVGATADGDNVQQWRVNDQANQMWQLNPVGGGYYQLIAIHSGKALDAAGWTTDDGGNIHQWDPADKANQQWRLEAVGDGTYRVINRHSGKLLDVAGGPDATEDATNVQQWERNDQLNQHWRFIRVTSH